MAFYLDTSAVVKLVRREPETVALKRWLAARERTPTSSDLTRTELLRAVRRAAPARAQRARAVLDALTLVSPAPTTFDAAGRLEPAGLRSLDAVHLACALELGDDLEGIVTYDARLAEGAAALGVTVVAPT